MIVVANETLKDSTLTINSNNINYPVTNILDSRLTKIVKTDSNTTMTIVFDAGSAVNVNSISIANHNISSGATIKFQGNATNVWTTPTIDETLTYSSGIINKQFTGGSYRYWRLNIVDAGNSDGFISAGRVYGGTISSPPSIGQTFSNTRVSESLKTYSISGQAYGDNRYFYDLISIQWRKITQAEKALIIAWFETLDITKPFFLVFDESKMDLTAKYVTIDSNQISFNYLKNPAWVEASLTFREEV